MTDSSAGGGRRPSVARRLGRLRGLVGAAGVVAIGSVAGCSARPDADPSTAHTGGVTVSTETSERSPGSAPPPPSAGPAPSTAECRERAGTLESTLAAVREEIRQLEGELRPLRRRRDNLEEVSALYEPPSAELVSRAEAVGTAARDAVVFLELGGGSATGWYVDDHHVVTNAHNVFDHHRGQARTATVWTLDGDRHEAETVDLVPSLAPDVALLRTAEPGRATLSPGSDPDAGSNEPLVQVGHPGGIGNWMITLGRLLGVEEYQTPDGTSVAELKTTVPGRQGVSGSPLLNLDGRVVGLTYAGSPVQDKQPAEPPIVAEPVVYDRPIASLSYGSHVPIDTVMAHYEEWT